MNEKGATKMRGLSLWQPWASLIGRGKSIETRHWPTSYRGPLAIHAAKRFHKEERDLCATEPFCSALMLDFPERARDLPLGAIVAVVTQVDCLEVWGGQKRCCPPGFLDPATLDCTERAFGNYQPVRFAHVYQDIRVLKEPIPYRGAQGFFEISDPALLAILDAA